MTNWITLPTWLKSKARVRSDDMKDQLKGVRHALRAATEEIEKAVKERQNEKAHD